MRGFYFMDKEKQIRTSIFSPILLYFKNKMVLNDQDGGVGGGKRKSLLETGNPIAGIQH